ncbi:hypothetical protein Zmor_017720 [Zophobas morio]|uniref:Uncharacterized protein n=1 Tax=Zophobas morio TaxID=2755281 RepID=A0AA38I9Y1_9CUCU|nr:hypothetical protein Zmor_017720 [Zophobas morio]
MLLHTCLAAFEKDTGARVPTGLAWSKTFHAGLGLRYPFPPCKILAFLAPSPPRTNRVPMVEVPGTKLSALLLGSEGFAWPSSQLPFEKKPVPREAGS